jgi:hypothetical protein
MSTVTQQQAASGTEVFSVRSRPDAKAGFEADSFPSSAKQTQRTVWATKLRSASDVILRHTTKHTGVGIVCAVAYFDPWVRHIDYLSGTA